MANKCIECSTQKELEECCGGGDIAVVRQGIFTAYGSNQVTAYGSSQVTACGSNQVTAYDSSQVKACGSSQVTAYGYVAITQHGMDAKITKGKHCKLIKVPPIVSLEDYLERYPIEEAENTIILYKAVNENMTSLCSRTPITYPESGIVKSDKIDPPDKGSCAEGLHFAHFDWAVSFGQGYGKFVILKARIPKKSIVVSPDCDGKIRTNEAEIIEVIKDWQHYNPIPSKKVVL